MSKTIKIILAFLLFICLAKMPYSYYELVRMIAVVGFVILGYQLYCQKRIIETIIYFGLALLFQPIFKIALGRTVWTIVDVIVGIFLLMSIFIKFDNLKINQKLRNKK